MFAIHKVGTTLIAFACLAAVQGSSQSPLSQSLPLDTPSHSGAKTEAVQYVFPEQVTVQAGKSTSVAMHFRITQGLHINSHTPKDEYLIPTSLEIPASSGVHLDAANYPSGTDFTLPADPKTKLNVYTGDFEIETHITATPGDHLVEAKLHYQACDQTQCMPPRTASVTIDIIGK